MDIKTDSPRVRNSERTREKILDAALELILDHGFGSTSVDAVVTRAGITKGAFFHHFASKADLSRALVDRYAAMDQEHFRQMLARAQALATDPLQQLLVLIALYEEEFNALDAPFPGCLFASFIYEKKLFDEGTLEVLRASTLFWRAELMALLEKVMAVHKPRKPVDLESLADLFYAITEGAFVMTKTLGDKTLLSRQSRHMRTYLELLFAPE
jgi:TetR/AcrR family transcriptional repressor of nem operon